MNHYITITLLIIGLSHAACDNSKHKTFGHVQKFDPALDSIIAEDAEVEIIGEGFEWSEGPLWIEKDSMLLFSDIPVNSIFKWTEAKGTELYLKPSGYTSSVKRGGEVGSNGLLLNDKGQLILCQHGDRRIALMNAPIDKPAPSFVTLAEQYDGKKFDSPNDAVMRSNGDIFFTDPPYGLEKNAEDTNKAAPYQGVYKLAANGKVTLLTDTITRPNGIGLFPGERSIIIASSDSTKAIWYVYDLGINDSLVNGRIFYDATAEAKKESGLPDGLKFDKDGHIFATGPGGVWIFDTNGKVLGKILIGGATSNCALSDDKTLYITADMYLLRVKLR